ARRRDLGIAHPFHPLQTAELHRPLPRKSPGAPPLPPPPAPRPGQRTRQHTRASRSIHHRDSLPPQKPKKSVTSGKIGVSLSLATLPKIYFQKVAHFSATKITKQ